MGGQTCEHLSDPLAGGDPCVQLRLSFPLLPTRGIQGHSHEPLCVGGVCIPPFKKADPVFQKGVGS